MDNNELAAAHIAEWAAYRKNILTPLLENCLKCEFKDAKIVADCTKIAQEGERRAYQFMSAAPDETVEIDFGADE